MLKRYELHGCKGYCYGGWGAKEEEDGEYVRYEDAQALELRIAELEQQLKTPEQKRAEFEEDCEREPCQ